MGIGHCSRSIGHSARTITLSRHAHLHRRQHATNYLRIGFDIHDVPIQQGLSLCQKRKGIEENVNGYEFMGKCLEFLLYILLFLILIIY